ncbi:DUF3088 domain-containing protein [Sphingomonas sp. ac-8]|uniref:DUF3088 domain-containing protein n=1 Tax=Sphingomonas sp. ac-8 TaxID=3242977 RepID=UPI003A801388
MSEPGQGTRDRLILIDPASTDPDYPDAHFFCFDCIVIEGVLAAYPQLRERIDVEHVVWARPRERVVSLVGEAHQSLPLLILGDDAAADLATGEANGLRFADTRDAILEALAVRHEMPRRHP